MEDTANVDDTFQIDDTIELDDSDEYDILFSSLININSQQTQVDAIRFTSNGNFVVPEYYNLWDYFNNIETIDYTTYTIDSTTELNSSDETSVLLSLLLGVDSISYTINKFRIYKNKLLCAGVLENQVLD